MPRKIGKNVAKKSRGRSRSRIRTQKVSRSLRRNSRRNSVVKRKKKSRRKQRGRGNNDFVSNTDTSDARKPCVSDAEVEQAASDQETLNDSFAVSNKQPECLMSTEQCSAQGDKYLLFEKDGQYAPSPSDAPCLEEGKVCRRKSLQTGTRYYMCEKPER
jgi:hypothetical protein